MGFNFGAFAAGAVKGAGDVMEEQHKETKESIDKSMTFAFQQGLPYHRARKEKLRKMTGMASDIQGMGLSPAQVSVVMGRSPEYIAAFIESSLKEQKNNPKFQPASQVQVTGGDKGIITPWQEVQFGSINREEINRPKQAPNKTLLGSMLGADDSTSSSSGFNDMVDKASSQYSSITGANYEDVTAAAQNNYTYQQGTEGTIKMVDSSSAMSYTAQEQALRESQTLSPIRINSAVLQYKMLQKTDERNDDEQPLIDLLNDIKMKSGKALMDSGLIETRLDDELQTISYNTRQRRYSTNPTAGLYAIEAAMLEEKLKDSPDPDILAKLSVARMEVNSLLGLQQERDRDVGQVPAASFFGNSYDGRVMDILANTVDPDDDSWVTNEQTGEVSFQYKTKDAQAYQVAAKKRAAYEFTKKLRSHKGRQSNLYLDYFMSQETYMDKDFIDVDMYPDAPSDNTAIDEDQIYLITNTASATSIDPKGLIRPPVFEKRSGKWILENRATQAANAAQNISDADREDFLAEASGISTNMSADPFVPPQAISISAQQTIDRTNRINAANAQGDAEKELAKQNLANTSDEDQRALRGLFNELSQTRNMEDDVRMEKLKDLAKRGTYWVHIQYANQELARLGAK